MKLFKKIKSRYTVLEMFAFIVAFISLAIGLFAIDSKTILNLLISIVGLLGAAIIVISKSRNDQKLAKRLDIDFEGFGGLVIQGLVVNEFSYLLRLVSKGSLSSFNNFELIYKSKDELLKNIEVELAKDLTKEEEVFGVSKITAHSNLTNLNKIIRAICEYYEEKQE